MIFYKYRANSVFTDKIFSDKKIWLANARSLNDPFECSIQEIGKDWIKKNVLEQRQMQFSGFLFLAVKAMRCEDDFFGMSVEQTEYILEHLKNKDFEYLYKFYRIFIKIAMGHYPSDPNMTFINFDKQLNEVGIFSLSETVDNQLMWSHYAEESRGIAIGFDIDADSKSLENKFVKVNYSDVLPASSGEGFLTQMSFYYDEYLKPYTRQKISFKDPTFKLAITTKPTCWDYEKEWRYIEEVSGAYAFPGAIKEVIFGLRCSYDDRIRYKDLIKNNIENDVDFFEICKVYNTNRIEKKGFVF